MGATGQQSGQACQSRTAFDGQLHCDVVSAKQTHGMGSSEGKPADSQFCRLSADIASTSGLSTAGAAVPLSLSAVSLFTDEAGSVSAPDLTLTGHSSDVGTCTSDGMPHSELACVAPDKQHRPVLHHPQSPKAPSRGLPSAYAEQPTQSNATAAQQQQAASFHKGQAASTSHQAPASDHKRAAGAQHLNTPCASVEQSIDMAPPSLQSWAGNENDSCGLASKSASLNTSTTFGAASPRTGAALPTITQPTATPAGPQHFEALQESGKDVVRGDEQVGSPPRRSQIVDARTSRDSDSAPAFWEGRRGSPSSSGHVHGSSAALSALAQAYSRGGHLGSPMAAWSAQGCSQVEQGSLTAAQGSGGAGGGSPTIVQDSEMATTERRPLETSQLLRAMAAKIDSQTSLQDMGTQPMPALAQYSLVSPCSTQNPVDSRGQASGAKSEEAPHHGTVFEHWPSVELQAPPNPFAAASEQAEQGAAAEVKLPQATSVQAGPGSAALPDRNTDAETSNAALSMCCEAGSFIQGSPMYNTHTANQGRSNAHSLPDSWHGTGSPGASGGPRGRSLSMLAGGSSGRLTPMDRSQHSTGKGRLPERACSHVSTCCQPGTQEGLWDSQRCQRQGTCTSAPTSGSIMKSSVLEDSAKESYSPAELEHMEKAWAHMGAARNSGEKLRLQKQALISRDSAASASQADGPCASTKRQGLLQPGSGSRPSDVEASCENQAGSKFFTSRSGMSGMSQVRNPISDASCCQSAGSVGSRLTATNLTEFENLQRQISRKDRTRSSLHERTYAWLAQAELPAEFEYSAKRAAKLKERCDSYSPKMSNPFETKHKAACVPPKQPAASAKKPNVFKRFIACISIEPWLGRGRRNFGYPQPSAEGANS